MEQNYLVTGYVARERIASCQHDALPVHHGTASSIIAIIGRSAHAISRAADHVARWAEGAPEPARSTSHRAAVQ